MNCGTSNSLLVIKIISFALQASPESLLSPSHGSHPIEDPLEDPHKFEISGE